MKHRGAAALALTIPCLSGLGYLVAFEAPTRFVVMNGTALVLALLWIAVGRIPAKGVPATAMCAILLLLLAIPLVTGPSLGGVRRWIPLGTITLHAGTLAIPALTLLAARERTFGFVILVVATVLTMLQPDAASILAVAGGCIGLWFANRDWKAVVTAGFALVAGAFALFSDDLPPQPFVERVLADLAHTSPLVALALAASLLVSFALIARAMGTSGFALAGSLAGFSLAALVDNYPSILIGYGAAPILGYGFALGLSPNPKETNEAK
ncbi:MAG: hypothetical protein AAF941_00865 [Pseudomonadota bacterium]